MNNKMKIWLGEKKERLNLIRKLRNKKLDLDSLSLFNRLLNLNEIDKNDQYAIKIGMQTNVCTQTYFGVSDNEDFPSLKIYMYCTNRTIRIESIYTISKSKTITECVTFNNEVDIACIRDDKPNDYKDSINRIDTVKSVICNSMIYTLDKYIKRWY